jgi:hypothetical protein
MFKNPPKKSKLGSWALGLLAGGRSIIQTSNVEVWMILTTRAERRYLCFTYFVSDAPEYVYSENIK